MESIGKALAKRVDHDRLNSIVNQLMGNVEIQTFISANKLTETEISRSYAKFYEFLNHRNGDSAMFEGYVPVLTMSGRLVDVSYRETDKHLTMRKNASMVRKFNNDSVVPDVTVKNASFDNFKVETNQESEALKFARSLAEYYQKGGTGNAIFSGPAGTGKSHLSISILKSCLEVNGMSVLFASFSEVLHLIKDSFSNRDSKYSQEYFMRIFRDVDLLVLDDIGSEQITEWSQALLTDVLDGRTKTIITTNLSSEDLKRKYDQRIYSRLMRGIGKKAFNFKDIKDKRAAQLPF